MADNLIRFPKEPRKARVQYKGLARRFQRVELKRELEPVRQTELGLLPHHEEYPLEWYTARYDGPGDGYREAAVVSLRELGIRPELLLYRVLRDLYGQPDQVTVGFPKGLISERRQQREGEGPILWEWGFMLKGASAACFEIRKQPGTQEPHLAVWVPTVTADASAQKGYDEDLRALLTELTKTLEQSRALIDLKALYKSSTSLGPLNVYADLMASGDEQLAAASFMKSRYKKLDARNRASDHPTPSLGTFFVAAGIQYLLALEAYINTLSELLRKPEFADPLYDRATTRADFEMRLLSLSLYCVGFERAPFAPEAPVFKRIRLLRDFRNNVLHGNLSHHDHVLRVVPEDHYIFHWWPAVDEHGIGKPDGGLEWLPLARVLFTKRHADKIRAAVEEAIDSILEALDSRHGAWARRWRRSQIVPAVLKDECWHPNLGAD